MAPVRNEHLDREATSNSVYEARWLLGSIFALALVIAGIGLFV